MHVSMEFFLDIIPPTVTYQQKSAEKHLKYFCDGERRSVGIAGEKGMTALTVAQAVAVCEELRKVLDVYFDVKV